MVDCLGRRDRLFLEELAQAGVMGLKVIEAAQTPAWAAKYVPKPPDIGQRAVSAFINGDGITYGLVSIVVPVASGSGAVKTLLIDPEIEAR